MDHCRDCKYPYTRRTLRKYGGVCAKCKSVRMIAKHARRSGRRASVDPESDRSDSESESEPEPAEHKRRFRRLRRWVGATSPEVENAESEPDRPPPFNPEAGELPAIDRAPDETRAEGQPEEQPEEQPDEKRATLATMGASASEAIADLILRNTVLCPRARRKFGSVAGYISTLLDDAGALDAWMDAHEKLMKKGATGPGKLQVQLTGAGGVLVVER